MGSEQRSDLRRRSYRERVANSVIQAANRKKTVTDAR
jgi:hypothetical protein